MVDTQSSSAFFPAFHRGFVATCKGFALVVRTPALRELYGLYVLAIAGLAALTFGGLVVGTLALLSLWALPALLYWPLVVLLMLLCGLLSPLIAVVAVNLIFPLLNEKIFFAGLLAIDPSLAAYWQARPAMPFFRALVVHAKIFGMAILLAGVAALLGLIPVVGAPLGLAVGIYATTRTLALEMCEPIWSRSGDDLASARLFWQKYHASLCGFALPWASLASIPLLNGALFGICQAATAQWVRECMPLASSIANSAIDETN